MNTKPSTLDMFVSEVSRAGESQFTGGVYPVQARLQAPIYGYVEAFTGKAGTSRNKVINQILEIGIEQALKALPPALAAEIREQAGKTILETIKNAETDSM